MREREFWSLLPREFYRLLDKHREREEQQVKTTWEQLITAACLTIAHIPHFPNEDGTMPQLPHPADSSDNVSVEAALAEGIERGRQFSERKRAKREATVE